MYIVNREAVVIVKWQKAKRQKVLVTTNLATYLGIAYLWGKECRITSLSTLTPQI